MFGLRKELRVVREAHGDSPRNFNLLGLPMRKRAPLTYRAATGGKAEAQSVDAAGAKGNAELLVLDPRSLRFGVQRVASVNDGARRSLILPLARSRVSVAKLVDAAIRMFYGVDCPRIRRSAVRVHPAVPEPTERESDFVVTQLVTFGPV
jgi:hypothetical protein